jgi:hypothetical protein
MITYNLALLSKSERDDIALEKYAAMLIKKVKLGKMQQREVKAELASEQNPVRYDKFKMYLNKYRVV